MKRVNDDSEISSHVYGIVITLEFVIDSLEVNKKLKIDKVTILSDEQNNLGVIKTY